MSFAHTESVVKNIFVGPVGGYGGSTSLARTLHGHYFNPMHEEFASKTLWSLSNAFTSAFKELEPVPQFKATARLGEFLQIFGK